VLARVRIEDGKVSQLVSLAAYPGLARGWSGLAPDNSPLPLRDLGFSEIYSLSFRIPIISVLKDRELLHLQYCSNPSRYLHLARSRKEKRVLGAHLNTLYPSFFIAVLQAPFLSKDWNKSSSVLVQTKAFDSGEDAFGPRPIEHGAAFGWTSRHELFG